MEMASAPRESLDSWRWSAAATTPSRREERTIEAARLIHGDRMLRVWLHDPGVWAHSAGDADIESRFLAFVDIIGQSAEYHSLFDHCGCNPASALVKVALTCAQESKFLPADMTLTATKLAVSAANPPSNA